MNIQKIPRAVLIYLLCGLCFSQTRPEFEVASIKPSPETAAELTQAGVHIDGAQVRFASLPLQTYIQMAYRLKSYQVAGPDWLSSQRFDIVAKLPEGSMQSQVPEMLQALLADRFKMKVHRDSREFPVYALEVAKGGARLTPPSEVGESGSDKNSLNISASGSIKGVGVNLGNGSAYSFADNRFEGRKLTLPMLVDALSRFVDRPIVDKTNLQGAYDFAFEVSPEDYFAMLIQSAVSAGVNLPPQALRVLDAPSGDSLRNAMEKIGLKLQSGKAPLEVIVVDSIQKAPTEN